MKSEGMHGDRLAFHQDGLEGLNPESVKRRFSIQEHRMVLNDLFEGDPRFVFLPFDKIPGLMDRIHEPQVNETLVYVWLEEFQRHFLGKTALVDLELGIDNDHRNAGVVSPLTDELPEQGIITSQVIGHLVDDELVIADLTGSNPNVFYELAVRHAINKPVIQIIQAGEAIPFDVVGMRTLSIDHHDLDAVADFKSDVAAQIESIEANPGKVESPISATVELQAMRQGQFRRFEDIMGIYLLATIIGGVS